MKRVLYLMHVDWDWIKQRPHFLAEQLIGRLEVDVAYLRAFRRSTLTRNQRDSGATFTRLLRFPTALTELPSLARLDRAWLAHQLRALMRLRDYDYVWLGSPAFYPAVSGALGRARLVYDCMDDCDGISHTASSRRFALDAERELLKRADLVVVSSRKLAELVVARGHSGTPLLLNNALAGPAVSHPPPPRTRAPGDPFRLFYFGTVGRWFDITGISTLLEHFPSVILRVAGPLEVQLPRHPRIEYVGVVPHAALPGLAADCDALVMPFVVNDLVRAVDPVKLYEYIALERNILVCDYPEIRRFGEFVYTYSSHRELTDLVARLLEENRIRYSRERARMFLSEHTWDKRGARLLDALARL